MQTVNITKVCVTGQLAAIKLTIPHQLTEKFGITKVKKMLKDYRHPPSYLGKLVVVVLAAVAGTVTWMQMQI